MKKIFLRMIMFLLVMVSFIQCEEKKNNRLFYVDDLGLYVHINRIGENRYRISVNKSADQEGEDYIDVSYMISEMPSITLNFPLDNSKSINVIDRLHGEVRNWNSKNFNIVYPDIDVQNRDERLAYREWCDSVMFKNPSISVEVCAYLVNLWVYDNNKKSGRKISQYNNVPL